MPKKQVFKKLPENSPIKILHLQIVITSPSPTDGKMLVVPITTWYGNRPEDSSVILEKGDHPAIEHKSWVKFNEITAMTQKEIDYCVNNYSAKFIDISDEILKHIQSQAMISEVIPGKYTKYFKYF